MTQPNYYVSEQCSRNHILRNTILFVCFFSIEETSKISVGFNLKNKHEETFLLLITLLLPSGK